MDTQKKPQEGAVSLPAIMNSNPNPNLKTIVTASGIEFFGDLSLAEWGELGRMLIPLAKMIEFLLGNWINHGSKAYGNKYKEALEFTGLAPKTLRNYASVTRRVDPTLREPSLGHEHHAAVARLGPHEQKHWLGLAKEHKLTVRRLRKSIQLGCLVSGRKWRMEALRRQHGPLPPLPGIKDRIIPLRTQAELVAKGQGTEELCRQLRRPGGRGRMLYLPGAASGPRHAVDQPAGQRQLGDRRTVGRLQSPGGQGHPGCGRSVAGAVSAWRAR